MASWGQRLKIRLFLEGQEVPVIAASVSMVKNSPSSASIQVIATDAALELLPRTLVHLFFFDFAEADGPLSGEPRAQTFENVSQAFDGNREVAGVRQAAFQQTPGLSDQDKLNAQFKLMFAGEVLGYSFIKSASGSRSVVLKCLDLSNYWDTAYQYTAFEVTGYGRRQANFMGAGSGVFNQIVGGGTLTLGRLLSSRSAAFPRAKGLLAGVLHLLEHVGGVYYGQRTFTGINDFFGVAELRLKFSRMLATAPDDNTSSNLFSRKAFMQWIVGGLQSLGTFISFRDMLKFITQYIYVESMPCPAAYLRPADVVSPASVKRGVSTQTIESSHKELFSEVNRISVIVNNRRTKALSQDSDFVNEARNIQADVQTYRKDLIKVIGSASDSVPKIVVSQLRIARVKLGRIVDRAGNPTRAVFDEFVGLMGLAVAALQTAGKLPSRRVVSNSKFAVESSRLQNQILRPDLYFAAPPNCNVIFPEHVSTMQMQRDYLAEPTRLQISLGHWLARGIGFPEAANSRYYAPDTRDMRTGVLKLDDARQHKVILEHEVYTGIVPVIERLPEMSAYGAKGGSKKLGNSRRHGFAQRLANFNYFKYRYASRRCGFSGRFNPYLAPGFPCVIIERPMPPGVVDEIRKLINDRTAAQVKAPAPRVRGLSGEVDEIRQPAEPRLADILRSRVPASYIGMLNTLTHTVNQQGGFSEGQLETARTHKESTQLLGSDQVDRVTFVGSAKRTFIWAVRARSATGTALGNDQVDPFEAQIRPGSKGPAGGTIISVQHEPDRWENSQQREAFGRGKLRIQSGEGVHAYEIREEIPLFKRLRGPQPMEEIVRPPWLDETYTNPRIHEVYDFLFGTGSITEATTVQIENSQVVSTPKGQNIQGPSKGRGAYNAAHAALVGSKDLGAVTTQTSKALDPILQAMLETDGSIEDSINLIINIYSVLRSSGMDVNEFVRSSTWRPIASMLEILGTGDVAYDPPEASGGNATLQKITLVAGAEGFHSRSFSDVGNLYGLADSRAKITKKGRSQSILNLGADAVGAAARLDPRAARYAAVQQYTLELATRALLG